MRGMPRPWQGQGHCGSGLHTASTGIAGSAESASLEAVPAAATPLTGIDVDLEACTVFLRGGDVRPGGGAPARRGGRSARPRRTPPPLRRGRHLSTVRRSPAPPHLDARPGEASPVSVRA
jgi:hypothetical protein